jgi:hypothetical protein
MRAMVRDSTVPASVAAILALTATTAVAAVPPPPINGVVVEDVTQRFSFDRIGVEYDTGPYTVKDLYEGTVRSMVIRAPDDTFDFYFHITPSTARLRTFSFLWQTPTSYTVAYHVTDPVVLWRPSGPSGPAPGESAVDALELRALWTEAENIDSGGSLLEGMIVLDTDARAYAATGTYQLGDSINRMLGYYDGQSADFVTFGPAIPEPETYALMLCGLGLLALGRRLRHRQ